MPEQSTNAQASVTQINKSLVSAAKGSIGLGSNLLWLLGDHGVRVVLAVLLNAAIARTLSLQEFGLYSLVVAVILFGRRFISAGLDGILTQSLIENPQHAPKLLGTSLVIRAAWGIVTAGGICAALLISASVSGTAAWLLAAGLIGNIALCAEIIDNQFQAGEAAKVPARARTLAWFLISSLQGLILLSGGRVIALLCVQAAYPVIYAGILIAFGKRNGLEINHFIWSNDTARLLISAAWPLLVSAVGVSLYVRFGAVMLGLLASREQVAVYAIAAQLVEVWHIVPPLIVTALFPRLLRLRLSDGDGFKKVASALFATLFYAGGTVCLGYWVAIGPVVRLVFGEEYAGAAAVASLSILTVPFAAWGALLSRMIITERATTFSITRHLAGAGVGLCVAWLLIPRCGAIGAAAGSVSAFVVSCYAAIWLDSRMRPYALLMLRDLLAPKRALAQCLALIRNPDGLNKATH